MRLGTDLVNRDNFHSFQFLSAAPIRRETKGAAENNQVTDFRREHGKTLRRKLVKVLKVQIADISFGDTQLIVHRDLAGGTTFPSLKAELCYDKTEMPRIQHHGCSPASAAAPEMKRRRGEGRARTASLSHALVSAVYTLEHSILPLSTYKMEIHPLIVQKRNQASPNPPRGIGAPQNYL